MRSARAYPAAFGASGSLVVAAALVFVLASAFVVYRGWPHVEAAGSPASVTIKPPPASAASPTARRLSAILATALPRAGGPDPRSARGRVDRKGPAGGRASGRAGHPGAPRAAKTGAPASAPPASAATGVPLASAPRAVRAYGYCCRAPVATPATGVVKQTTGAVRRSVSGAGSTAGSAVGRLGGAVSRTTGSLPPAGGAGSRALNGAAGVLNGTVVPGSTTGAGVP